jgi:hypothetical protein
MDHIDHKLSDYCCKVDSVAALARAAHVPSVLVLICSFDAIPSDIHCNVIEQCSDMIRRTIFDSDARCIYSSTRHPKTVSASLMS